jgi:hypothetical protein
MEITGAGKSYFFGYMKENVLEMIESYNDEKLKEFYKGLLNIGSNKCEYLDLSYKVLTDTSLIINYRIVLPSYVTQFDNKYYLNPHLFKSGIDDYGVDSSKQYPVQFKYRSFSKNVLKVNMDDIKVNHLSANQSIEKEKYGFSINYTTSEKYVRIDSRYYENMMQLAKPDFPEYEVYYAALRKTKLDNIEFIKK